MKTYGGTVDRLYSKLLNQSHILIAGTTGSGKSVLENGFIYRIAIDSPEKNKLILCDIKQVELIQWQTLPHSLLYADTFEAITQAVIYAHDIMNQRFKQMKRKQLKKYDGSQIWLIFDEIADLRFYSWHDIEKPLNSILSRGRAAGVHCVLCTQRAKATLTPFMRANADCKIALRTVSRDESKLIIDASGAELLPRYGSGLISFPGEPINRYLIPLITDREISQVVQYYDRQLHPLKHLFRR